MRNSDILLYDDERFRTVGPPSVVLPASALEALVDVRQRLVEHPDTRIVPCICGGNRDIRVTFCDRFGLPVNLMLCRSCGLIRANPQPDSDGLSWFYAEVYRRLHGPFAPTDMALFNAKVWKGRLVLDALSQARVVLPPGLVVDIGCGGGWTLAALVEAGHSCLGFDYDERLIAIGRDRGLDLRLGGVQEAVEADVRAVLLIFGHVLEHVPDPETELRKLRSILHDSGFLYLEVPHTRRIGSAALRNDSLRYWQRAHLWEFQCCHVRALAERAGYEVIWASEDSKSVFALCRPGGMETHPSWPHVGAEVEAQLLGFESRYQSRTYRFVTAAQRFYRRRSKRLRDFLGRRSTNAS